MVSTPLPKNKQRTPRRKATVSKQSTRAHRVKVVAKSKGKKSAKNHLSRRLVLSIFGLTLGLNLLFGSGWYLWYRQTILSFSVVPQVIVQPELRGSLPANIGIETIGLNLAIQPTQIVDGVWQTSSTNPTYLVTSSRPGEGGNIVVYGHNYNQIFAPLKKVATGDLITIATENGKFFSYEVTEIQVVKPTEIEAVLPTDYEVLTVYTCTGLFDSLRLVIKATPRGVS